MTTTMEDPGKYVTLITTTIAASIVVVVITCKINEYETLKLAFQSNMEQRLVLTPDGGYRVLWVRIGSSVQPPAEKP